MMGYELWNRQIRNSLGVYKRNIPLHEKFKPEELLDKDSVLSEKCLLINITNADEFEYYVCKQLEFSGFDSIKVLSKTDDLEVDISAFKDGKLYVIQSVFCNKLVDANEIVETNGWRKLYRVDKALIITNSYYTENAKIKARLYGVECWDKNILEKIEKGIDTI